MPEDSALRKEFESLSEEFRCYKAEEADRTQKLRDEIARYKQLYEASQRATPSSQMQPSDLLQPPAMAENPSNSRLDQLEQQFINDNDNDNE